MRVFANRQYGPGLSTNQHLVSRDCFLSSKTDKGGQDSPTQQDSQSPALVWRNPTHVRREITLRIFPCDIEPNRAPDAPLCSSPGVDNPQQVSFGQRPPVALRPQRYAGAKEDRRCPIATPTRQCLRERRCHQLSTDPDR